jgi:hypothetical protein
MEQETFYHISPTKNKESILTNGLKSNDGYIFFFTNISQQIHIAANQLRICEYSVFQILPEGFTVPLENDNVAEMGSEHQVYIRQDLIKPQFVKHLNDVNDNMYDIIEASAYPMFKGMGWSDEQYIELVRMFPDRIKRYNEVNGTNYTVIETPMFTN